MGRRIDDMEVEVRVDGIWYPGWLDPDSWRQDPDTRRWSATVRWQSGPAENRLRGSDQDDIRQVADKLGRQLPGD